MNHIFHNNNERCKNTTVQWEYTAGRGIGIIRRGFIKDGLYGGNWSERPYKAALQSHKHYGHITANTWLNLRGTRSALVLNFSLTQFEAI